MSLPPSERTAEAIACAEALRGLRSRSGLSLKELGAQTPYSKSSWERYLNGKTHPPRGAVVALCRLARQPPAHPLALWERAETARNRPPRPAVPLPAPAPELTAVPEPVSVREESSPPEPRDPRPAAARRHVRTGAVLAAALLCAAWLVMAGPWRSERADADAPASSEPEFACHGQRCTGRDVIATRCGMHPDMVSTHRPAPGLRVDLRYEAGCGAGWARVWGQRIGDVFTVSVAGGEPQTLTVPDKYATGIRLHSPWSPRTARTPCASASASPLNRSQLRAGVMPSRRCLHVFMSSCGIAAARRQRLADE
ncbi:helix-turn-helix domain-containing protein [Streptomyces cyaneofuscatus]|uniref:helix-turn-helix domain-containing protein n=1 Tax=Streptomyces cyaneofuscatus TaxID=66883 RepID=UPI0037D285D7